MLLLVAILVIVSPTGHTAIKLDSQEVCKKAAHDIEQMSAATNGSCPAHGGGCWSAYGTFPISADCLEAGDGLENWPTQSPTL